MGWYRTGSVNVTQGSPDVTGVGTGWIAGAQAGHGFIGPDEKIREILSVNSNTSLTLVSPYVGASASGGAYGIMPTQGLVPSLASAAQALVNTVTGYISGALAGRFGSGTAASPGIAFATDLDTGFSNPAPNVVSLSTAAVERVQVSDRVMINASVGIGREAATQTLEVAGNVASVTGTGMGLLSGDKVSWTDNSRTANNRYTEMLWANGSILGRFVNDDYSAALDWLHIVGGYATGVASVTFLTGRNIPTLYLDAGVVDGSGRVVINGNSSDDWTGGAVQATVISRGAGNRAQSLWARGADGGALIERVDHTSTYYHEFFYGGSGTAAYVGGITTNGSGVFYGTASDARLKTNIADAPDSGPIIDALRIVSHDFIAGGRAEFGLVAQNAFAVYPDAVSSGDDGPRVVRAWEVDYSRYVPLLLQQARMLRARVSVLEAAAGPS